VATTDDATKGGVRAVAERLLVGVDRYGDGDYAGALAAFEEALALEPESARARRYIKWVQDVLAAAHAPDGPGTTAGAPALHASSHQHEEGDSPWDPLPLTPTEHLVEEPPPSRRPGLPARPAAPSAGMSSTLLGVPLYQPNNLRRGAPVDDPESVTREFHHENPPTGVGLGPLDVPELTEDQISALLSLDAPLLPGGATLPEYAVGTAPGPEAEAEDEERHLPKLAAAPTLPPVTVPATRREDTIRGSAQEMLPRTHSADHLTPLGAPTPQIGLASAAELGLSIEIDAELPPLESRREPSLAEELGDEGSNPTNPFIRARALAVVATFGTEPQLDALPPAPPAPSVRSPFETALTALAAGDLARAIDASEAALLRLGGLTSEAADRCHEDIERFYHSLLGGADRVPRHGAPTPDLDPRSAFLLSRLDGAMTVEDVLDVSGMPRLEAMRTLALLLRRGAIVLQ
jgi:hypothetical protein